MNLRPDRRRLKMEGSPASMFVQLMQKHGYNAGWQAETFYVSNTAPLTFKANDDIELDPDDYYINDALNDSDFQLGDKALVLFDMDDVTGVAYVIMKLR